MVFLVGTLVPDPEPRVQLRPLPSNRPLTQDCVLVAKLVRTDVFIWGYFYDPHLQVTVKGQPLVYPHGPPTARDESIPPPCLRDVSPGRTRVKIEYRPGLDVGNILTVTIHDVKWLKILGKID